MDTGLQSTSRSSLRIACQCGTESDTLLIPQANPPPSDSRLNFPHIRRFGVVQVDPVAIVKGAGVADPTALREAETLVTKKYLVYLDTVSIIVLQATSSPENISLDDRFPRAQQRMVPLQYSPSRHHLPCRGSRMGYHPQDGPADTSQHSSISWFLARSYAKRILHILSNSGSRTASYGRRVIRRCVSASGAAKISMTTARPSH